MSVTTTQIDLFTNVKDELLKAKDLLANEKAKNTYFRQKLQDITDSKELESIKNDIKAIQLDTAQIKIAIEDSVDNLIIKNNDLYLKKNSKIIELNDIVLEESPKKITHTLLKSALTLNDLVESIPKYMSLDINELEVLSLFPYNKFKEYIKTNPFEGDTYSDLLNLLNKYIPSHSNVTNVPNGFVLLHSNQVAKILKCSVENLIVLLKKKSLVGIKINATEYMICRKDLNLFIKNNYLNKDIINTLYIIPQIFYKYIYEAIIFNQTFLDIYNTIIFGKDLIEYSSNDNNVLDYCHELMSEFDSTLGEYMTSKGHKYANVYVIDWVKKYKPEIINDMIFFEDQVKNTPSYKGYGYIQFLKKYSSYDANTGELLLIKPISNNAISSNNISSNYLSPTELGKVLGLKGSVGNIVNLALNALGYQNKVTGGWLVTDKGNELSSNYPDKKLSILKAGQQKAKDSDNVAKYVTYYWLGKDILPILKEYFSKK